MQTRAEFDLCLLALKEWHHSLPPSLGADLDASSGLPASYILHMVYHTSVILLSRSSLQSKPTPSQVDDETCDGPVDSSRTAAILCLESAKQTAGLGKAFRKAYGSFRQCPITATHCTLTAVLVLIQVSSQNAGHSHSNDMGHIYSCLQTLQELSVAWSPADRYWRSVLHKLEGIHLGASWGRVGSAAGNQANVPSGETAGETGPTGKSDMSKNNSVHTQDFVCYKPAGSPSLRQKAQNQHLDGIQNDSIGKHSPAVGPAEDNLLSLPGDYAMFDTIYDGFFDDLDLSWIE